MFVDVSHEISTKVKRWAIILTVETVVFLAHMGYKNTIAFQATEKSTVICVNFLK